ncbi:MAG: DNA repair protein RecN [Saccharospirillaceae bacterium]|nr:DNA repair protein RecN [Pseudomonadales bacterium]NRB80689.1 DNA repair protein RecN [Saccharospirillaceae bacterium]
MLTQLSIRNFVLAKEIFLDIASGMTAITGETGAGKSILLNALNLALGGRAEQGIVRNGEDRSDVSASFDVSKQPHAYKWLQDNELNEQFDCILRRTVNKDGRSRAFINGQQVTLVQLKKLGSMLIDIHSQHQHQSLLKPSNHRRLLDDFAGNQKIVVKVKEAFLTWKKSNQLLNQLQQSREEHDAQRQLLNYQIDELSDLELSHSYIKKLELIQQSQSQIKQTQLALELSTAMLSDEVFNPSQVLDQCERNLLPLLKLYPQLQESIELIQTANIQIDEALNNLGHFSSNLENDPQELIETERQLSVIYELCRKHNVSPELLEAHYGYLCEQLEQLDNNEIQIEQLIPQVSILFDQYLKFCQKLNKTRKTSIKKFNKAICEQLVWLNMSGAQFRCKTTELSVELYNEHGTEFIEFEVALNAGQLFTSLQKSASGGELSRISLAIAVICAQQSCVPTMIFDEIDIGISGATAQMVGKLLKQLGQNAQLLCVTHLSQVASQANQHWLVAKNEVANQTISTICTLNENQRANEIARMIGGIEITEQTLAHATEILKASTAKLQ